MQVSPVGSPQAVAYRLCSRICVALCASVATAAGLGIAMIVHASRDDDDDWSGEPASGSDELVSGLALSGESASGLF